MINQSVIEELKIRNRIEDIVSSYVRLQRSGQNMKGLCPFHSEKTPSFHVNVSDGYFYCFGCGVGGDVISFVMKAENLSYPEALQFLADRVGMTLPNDIYSNGGFSPAGPTRTQIVAMNKEAARYYYRCLMNPKTPEGLDYFTKKRGFSLPLIKHFGMGYAPNNWHGLQNYMVEKGYTCEELHTAGLLSKSSKDGSYSDFFKDRAIVPIIDTSGNIIAFGGRRIHDDPNNPGMKYLNTFDTPAFHKSKNLFALNFAKDYCAERIILCEGYMDVIALHGAGFPFAVATLGTAITPEHARIMGRYTKSVIICYDADDAGQRAADKAFTVLDSVGVDAKIIKVENAKDPDEFIHKFGKDAFTEILDRSKSRFEFKFGQILAKYNINILDERVKAAEDSVKLIAAFSSSVQRELYVMSVSKKLNVPAESLKNEVEKQRRIAQKKEKNELSDTILRQTQGYTDRVNPQFIGNVAAARAEEAILGMMMLRDEIADYVVKNGEPKEEDFVTDFNKRMFVELSALAKVTGKADPTLLEDRLTPEESGRLLHMRIARSELSENGEKVFKECIKRLRESGKTKQAVDPMQEIIDILGEKRKKIGVKPERKDAE